GNDPSLEQPAYDPNKFVWNGYTPPNDRLFKSERLRLLWISTRRSQEMCRAALAHRRAQRLIKEGAPIAAVLELFDRAIDHAKTNQYIYQINYDDDYDWTDGLCYKVTERLEKQRAHFLSACAGRDRLLQSWNFNESGDLLGWKVANDMSAPVIEHGALVSHATSADPFIVQEQQLSIGPVKGAKYFVMEMSSDRAGIVQVFWAAEKGDARASEFSEQNSIQFPVNAGPNMGMHRVPLDWEGTLRRLRIDFPDQARVTVRSIGLIEATDTKAE